MSDSPRSPDSNDPVKGPVDHQSAVGTPRWVIVFGGVALAAVVIFVIVHIAGGGLHGHMPSVQGAGGRVPPSPVAGEGGQRP